MTSATQESRLHSTPRLRRPLLFIIDFIMASDSDATTYTRKSTVNPFLEKPLSGSKCDKPELECVMTTIRDSGGAGVLCFRRRGTRPNPFIYSSPTPLGAGEGKLRVLYAIRQIVS